MSVRTPVLKKFVPLVKVDVEKREVFGIVTAEAKDKDGEICDYAKTKPYYKAWAAEFEKATDGASCGNLREMHQLRAVGKGISIEFDDEAKEITMGFKVVDDEAWRKVTENVYTGFSQGGEYVSGPDKDGRYTAKVSEVSLVDNPCLGIARYALIRADMPVEMVKIRSIEEKPAVPSKEEIAARESLIAATMTKAAGQIAKGMYDVGTFARLLDDLNWIRQSAIWERDVEGDESEMPEKLLGSLQDLCETFLAMAQEETKELSAAAAKGANKVEKTELQKAAAELLKAKGSMASHFSKMASHHEKMGKCAMAKCDAANKMSDAFGKADGDDAQKATHAMHKSMADAHEKEAKEHEAMAAHYNKMAEAHGDDADKAEKALKAMATPPAPASEFAALQDMLKTALTPLADLSKTVDAAVEKALASKIQPTQVKAAGLELVPRPGETLNKASGEKFGDFGL